MRHVLFSILLIANTCFASRTFNPARIKSFQNDFTFDQIVILNKALEEPLPVVGPDRITPPQGKLNHVALVIKNNTGLAANRIYVVGKGQNLAATDAYFLQPNLNTGVCELVSSLTHNSADSDISVQLSRLPSAGPNAYLIYVPQMASGRFYLSVDAPLYMKTSISGGSSSIDDPSQTTIQDPNYYTLYQNFEFTLDGNYDLFANVTNVDYVALPLTLGSYSFPNGNVYPTLDGLTVVGFPETATRSSVLGAIQASLSLPGIASDWSSLSIPFYGNPYNNSDFQTTLRILAAKLSIALGATHQYFKGAPAPTFFSATYLQNTTSGPSSGKSYMQLLYEYYQSNQMQVTIFPAANPQVTYTMTAGMVSGELVFTPSGGIAPIIVVNLNHLTTDAILHGAIGQWVSGGAITPAATDPWQTEIAKILSSLFTAGLLPPPPELVQPIVVDESYFRPYRSLYFNNPLGFSLNGPWYNLYDKVVHPLFIQTGGFGLGYAYDFDDLLGLAGLLHVNVQRNGVLNQAEPYTLLSAGPIDTIIPNPKVEFGPYTLTYESLTPGSNGTDIIYSTNPNEPLSQIAVVHYGAPPISIPAVVNYFYVKHYTDPGKNTSVTYVVYPKYQLVLPTTTRYNELDANLMNGIFFHSDCSTSLIHVAFSFH